MSRCVVWDKDYRQYVGDGGHHVDDFTEAKVFHSNSRRTREKYRRDSYEFMPVKVVACALPRQ